MTIRANEFFFKAFKTSGGSAEMDVDGSTPVDFFVTAPSTGTVSVTRVIFVMVDAGIGYGEFGGLGSALTNGLEVKTFDVDDNLLIDWTDGLNIKANEDFGVLAGSDNVSVPAIGDDSFPVRWTVEKAGAVLRLEVGDYMRIRVQDNLSALTKFRAFLQGVQN
jgi:hypothetical protein